MTEPGQQFAVVIVVMLAIVVAVLAPILTVRRLRTRERRRDEWLSANAEPRLSAAMFVVTGLASILGGSVCALLAIAGYPLLWALTAMFVGLLASTVISGVVAFRTPKDLP